MKLLDLSPFFIFPSPIPFHDSHILAHLHLKNHSLQSYLIISHPSNISNAIFTYGGLDVAFLFSFFKYV